VAFSQIWPIGIDEIGHDAEVPNMPVDQNLTPKIRTILGTAKILPSDTSFTMGIAQLAGNCQKFENLKKLPYRVQSMVSEDVFQIFVSALGSTDLIFTTEKMSSGSRFFVPKYRRSRSYRVSRVKTSHWRTRAGCKERNYSASEPTRKVCAGAWKFERKI
jgi:hypothetical protein